MIFSDLEESIEKVQENPSIQTQWSNVYSVGELSRSQVEALKSLFELKNLASNWDSYGSSPPSQHALNISLSLFFFAARDLFPAPRITPVSSGGVQLTWQMGNRELELETLGNGSVEYLEIQDDSPIEEGELADPSVEAIEPLLDWLRWG